MHESVLIYKILDEVRPMIGPEYVLHAVVLEVGEHSCVSRRTLGQLFDVAKKNTFARSSKLKFSVVKNDSDIIIKSIEVLHEDRDQQRPVRNRKRAVGR